MWFISGKALAAIQDAGLSCSAPSILVQATAISTCTAAPNWPLDLPRPPPHRHNPVLTQRSPSPSFTHQRWFPVAASRPKSSRGPGPCVVWALCGLGLLSPPAHQAPHSQAPFVGLPASIPPLACPLFLCMCLSVPEGSPQGPLLNCSLLLILHCLRAPGGKPSPLLTACLHQGVSISLSGHLCLCEIILGLSVGPWDVCSWRAPRRLSQLPAVSSLSAGDMNKRVDGVTIPT